MIRSFYVLTNEGKILYSRPLQKEIDREITSLSNFSAIITEVQNSLIIDSNPSIMKFPVENLVLYFSVNPSYNLVLVTETGFKLTKQQQNYFFDKIYKHLARYDIVISSAVIIEMNDKFLKTILDPILDTVTVETISLTSTLQ